MGRREARRVSSSWQTQRGFPLPDTGRSDHNLWVPPVPVSPRRDDAGQRTPQGCWWIRLCVGGSPRRRIGPSSHQGLLLIPRIAQPRWMLARGILGSGRTGGVSFRPFLISSGWGCPILGAMLPTCPCGQCRVRGWVSTSWGGPSPQSSPSQQATQDRPSKSP